MDPRNATTDPYLTPTDRTVLAAIYSLHLVKSPDVMVPMTSEAIAQLAGCDVGAVERAWVRLSGCGYAGRFRREDGPIDYRCQHVDQGVLLRPPPDGPCPCQVLPAMADLLNLDDHGDNATYTVVIDPDPESTEARESLIDHLGQRQPHYGIATGPEDSMHRFVRDVDGGCRDCDQPKDAEIHRLR